MHQCALVLTSVLSKIKNGSVLVAIEDEELLNGARDNALMHRALTAARTICYIKHGIPDF